MNITEANTLLITMKHYFIAVLGGFLALTLPAWAGKYEYYNNGKLTAMPPADYSRLFVTTVYKPTEASARTIMTAANANGRVSEPKIQLHAPSGGFVVDLMVPGGRATEASFQAAAAELLKRPDVVCVYPAFVGTGETPTYVTGQTLMHVATQDLALWRGRLEVMGLHLAEVLNQGPQTVLVVDLPKGGDVFAQARNLWQSGKAATASPNLVFEAESHYVPNDPQYEQQTFLRQANDADIDWDQAIDILASNPTNQVKVAVVDGNGFDLTHPDLVGRFVNPYDAVNDDNDPSPENASANHGTPCAGLVAANTNNSLGVASVGASYVQVVPIVIGYNATNTSFTTTALITARAATHIIAQSSIVASSHSYGRKVGNPLYTDASVLASYTNMRNSPRGGLGACLLASTGNDTTLGSVNLPAYYGVAVGVGAVDVNDVKAIFSNYGDIVDIAAPGTSTLTIDRQGAAGYGNSDYTSFSGTSAACPIVAGVVGLMGAASSSSTATDFETALFQTANKVGGYSYTNNPFKSSSTSSTELGYGRVNARDAVGRIVGGYGTMGTAVTNLTCGQVYNGNLSGQSNDVNRYSTVLWLESGPDQTFSFTLTQLSTVTLTLSNMAQDLDVFLCSENNSATCFAAGDNSITQQLGPGTYFVNVDGANGATGAFSLNLSCTCIPTSSCQAIYLVTRVGINGVYSDSSLSCTSTGYESVPTPTFEIRRGSPNPYAISHRGNSGMYARIFLDLNGDNQFSYPTELAVDDGYKTRHTGTILISSKGPSASASPITRVMRVQGSSGGFISTADGCQSFGIGQTKDFNVTILPVQTRVVNYLGTRLCPGVQTSFDYTVTATDLAGSEGVALSIAPSAAGPFTLIGLDTLGAHTIKGTVPASYAGSTAYFKVTLTSVTEEALVTSIPVDVQAQILSVTPATNCGPGKVFIAATGSAGTTGGYTPVFDLYTAAAGGSPIGTSGPDGPTTPVLTSSGTYYVGYKYLHAGPPFATSCSAAFRAEVQVNIGAQTMAISSFSPNTGQPGTLVTIKGSGLSGVTKTQFNGTDAYSTTIPDANTIYALVGAGSTTGPISAFKNGCTVVSAGTFTVPAPSASDLAWRWARVASLSDGAERFNRVRTTPAGDHFVAGGFTQTTSFSGATTALSLTAAGGVDGALVKYNRAGIPQWAVRFGGAGDDEVLGLAVDKFGYAYVSGYFTGTMTIVPVTGAGSTLTSAGGTDMFVAKIHPNTGALVYAFRMGASGNDRAEGIDVAPDLRVYVAGSFVGTTAIGGISGTIIPLTSRGNSDAFLAKFTDIGTLYWAIQAGGTGNDFGYGAAADISGGGYLMGSYEGTATFNSSLAGTTPISKTVVGGSDGFVLGVSITGGLSWVASMGGTTNENVRDVAPDPRGTGVVAVGGFSNSATFGSLGSLTATGFYDAFAVRLSNAGAFEWVRKSGGFGQDQAWGVRMDRQGNPFVALSFSASAYKFGSTTDQNSSVDGLDGNVVKLAAATGLPLWNAQITGAYDEVPKGIDTVAQGGFIAAGYYNGQSNFGLVGPIYPWFGSQDGWMARYSTASSASREAEGVEAPVSPVAAGGGTLQLWPNPASGGSFSLLWKAGDAEALSGEADLKLYSTDGRQVLARRVPLAMLAGGVSVEAALPPGVYTVVLTQPDGDHQQARLLVQ
ncbi:S8 family serine peptidase [Nostoc sp. NIES-2111]